MFLTNRTHNREAEIRDGAIELLIFKMQSRRPSEMKRPRREAHRVAYIMRILNIQGLTGTPKGLPSNRAADPCWRVHRGGQGQFYSLVAR